MLSAPPVTVAPPLSWPAFDAVLAVLVNRPDTVPVLWLTKVPAFEIVPVQVPALVSQPLSLVAFPIQTPPLLLKMAPPPLLPAMSPVHTPVEVLVMVPVLVLTLAL